MERLPTWVALLALSIILIAATLDDKASIVDGGDARMNYYLSVAIISLIFSFFFIIANLIDRIGNLVIGNVFENAISAIVVALWVIAITFIQNPKNGAATEINNEGQETISYANLYFFSWLNFITALYLFGNVIRDNLAYNPKFTQWVLLFAASVVLTATSVAVHDDVCAIVADEVCGRLKYGVAVGAVGIVLSCISILATMFGHMGRILEIGGSFLSFVFYFFGVVVLTTSRGPASTLGNMYFSVWGGTFCAFALFYGAVTPNRTASAQGNSVQSGQHQMDDQI